MPAQKRIEIVAQFQGAVLQQAQQLRLLLQSCGNQLKRARKSGAPVLSFGQSRQQFATQMNPLQLCSEDRNVKIALAGIMPVNGYFIYFRGRSNFACAHSVVAELGKQRRSCGQNALFCAASCRA